MRLIDADALGIGRCNPDIFENKAYAVGWNEAVAMIENAPTVDAEPVQHGKWIAVEVEYINDTLYKCSECHEDFVTIDGMPGQNLYKYCPNCGAKMEEYRKE